jgi:galactosylceramidase
VNRTPKYLADQDGAFEVHACEHRSGNCLEQVITEKPIPWGPLPNPFTLTGDSNWTDYRVFADGLAMTSNEIAVIGRIDSANVFSDGKALWPSGYVLQVRKDGTWNLLSTAFKVPTRTLASGTATVTGWSRLGLAFQGDHITATINGKQIASVHDSSHKAGMFAVGTDWGRAQFDNVKVTH